MSADASFQSLATPDLSLGSLISRISTPAKSLRVSSLSSHTTAPSSAPVSTPSPPHPLVRRKGDEATPVVPRRHISTREGDDNLESDALNASQNGDNWEGDLGTPLNTRGKRSKSSATNPKGNNFTLRDQEKVRFVPHLSQHAPSYGCFFILAHRQPQEGEFQYKAQGSFPGGTSRSTCSRPSRICAQTKHQPQDRGSTTRHGTQEGPEARPRA
jgi:hypothetical protein